MAALKRYLIERDIPGIGGMSVVELCGAARASNQAIAKVSKVQWQHSYVAADQSFCIYLAENEAAVLEFERDVLAGAGADIVTGMSVEELKLLLSKQSFDALIMDGKIGGTGALPELYAATRPNLDGGLFVGPDGFDEQRGYPTVVAPVKAGRDEEAARRLWSVSEELTAVRYL